MSAFSVIPIFKDNAINFLENIEIFIDLGGRRSKVRLRKSKTHLEVEGMNSKKNAETKKRLLEFHFGRYYYRWLEEHEAGPINDDRNIFIGMYEQLVEAIDSMGRMKNSFVWVAFNNQMKKQEAEMCEIVKRFTGSYPIYGIGFTYDPSKF